MNRILKSDGQYFHHYQQDC